MRGVSHAGRRARIFDADFGKGGASLLSRAQRLERLAKPQQEEGIPAGLWLRCPECGDMLFRKVVDEALNVCPKCQHHFRIGARTRIEQLVDPGSFEEMFDDIEPSDPLKFADKKAYKDRLAAEQKKTGRNDAVMCGKGFIKGRPIMLAVMDPEFMMGSMGSVVGEIVTRSSPAFFRFSARRSSENPLVVSARSFNFGFGIADCGFAFSVAASKPETSDPVCDS